MRLPRNLPIVLIGVGLAACGGGSSSSDAMTSSDARPVVIDAALADASTPDAAPPDAAPDFIALWALVDGQLFRVDPTTAALTLVGSTGLATATVVDGAWNPTERTMRLITSTRATPSWSALSLCTGAVSVTGPVLQGVQNATEIEGVARDDAGTFFLGLDGNRSSNFLTEVVATFDPVTRVATPLATPADTLQDDLDQLEWGGGVLYALDVATALATSGIYSIDRATGAATLVTETAAEVVRLAWDPVGSRMLAATSDSPRQLDEVNLVTGERTRIGDTHTTAEFAGATLDVIFFAPVPDCPSL